MIWAPLSSWSCFCWLYRASPSLAAKNIISLISVLTVRWCPCVESSLVLLEEGVAMTSAFSWQNSVSLCPASFCTPRPNLPVIQISLDFLLWWLSFKLFLPKWSFCIFIWVLITWMCSLCEKYIELCTWFSHCALWIMHFSVWMFYLKQVYLKSDLFQAYVESILICPQSILNYN